MVAEGLHGLRIGTPHSRRGKPSSQPQAETPTNTTTALMRLVLLVSQGVSTYPDSV
jgi:hypothetical protein